MIRYQARISVYQKDEETNRRLIDFPHDKEFVARFKDEIEFLIKGVHLVDDEGNVYVLDVANIEALS